MKAHFVKGHMGVHGQSEPSVGYLYGLLAIGLAIGFNIPFAILAQIFDYPQILHFKPRDILGRFAEGGQGLIFCWYAFMISALLLVPLAPGLSITRRRLEQMPALAIGAAVSGALAGIAQAIGLSRWVFAVPLLAADPMLPAAQSGLSLLNAWGGNGIGEHIGQILMALFIGQTAILQLADGLRITVILGAVATFLLLAGALGTVLMGGMLEFFALVTVAGFAVVTLWLIASGTRQFIDAH